MLVNHESKSISLDIAEVKATMAKYRTMVEAGHYAELDSDGELGIAWTPLTERETLVLSLRMGISDGRCWTLEDVARLPEFACTRERIRQIEAKSLRKIADALDKIWG